MKNKEVWFWDLETLDIFTATFVHKDTDETLQFVYSDKKDQRKEMFEFMESRVSILIGFNSVFFDAQIIEYMYRYPECTPKNIKAYASILTADNNRKPDVPEHKLRFTHIDLFKALSLSTKAKMTGLKWCEFMIDFENIEDLPSDGEGSNWEEQVLSYNLNDVLATKALFYKYIYEIDIRNKLSKRENVFLLNSTEPDMAKKLFAKYLSSAMKISKFDLFSMGTDRDNVVVKDIIFPYVNFITPKLQQVHKEFLSLELQTQDKFEKVVNLGGIDITYALGGIHGSVSNRVVSPEEDESIETLDVQSFYPNLAIRNNLSPEHLPKEVFCSLYEGFFEERKNIPKSDPRNYILKILLNSAYGMTNDKFSFLRDRQMTLSICINGQLLLTMLFEELLEKIPESRLIMINTDGGEILIKKKYKDLYDQICEDWQKKTKLVLEFDTYKKLIIRDVNNYIAIYENGKTKCKGFFEFDGLELGEGKVFKMPLHKNKSFSIIPRAVYYYFVKGVPIEETIYNHKNIFDFCGGVKGGKTDIKGKSWYELIFIENKQIKTKKLSKTVRYFISKTGGTLIKKYEDGSYAQAEAPLNLGKMNKDWKVTYFNKSYKLDNFKDYGIDYSYYIHKAREAIENLETPNQLDLFK